MKRLLTPFNVVAGVLVLAAIALIAVRFIWGLGAISSGSQDQPWGLLLGWGLFSGVPMSATGFVVGTAVYLFGMREYHPVVRNAILVGLLGYFFAVVFLLIDLGRPWRLPFPMVVSFGTASVLFLIAWHVALYLTCQFLEFAPTILEWRRWRGLRAVALGATAGLTIFGVILSTLHQSALGAMFLLAPGKLHPLWYSPYIPILFLTSAIAAGICVVIAVSYLTQRFLRQHADAAYLGSLNGITLGLGRAAAFVLVTYLALKIVAVAHGDQWALLTTPYGSWFLVEVLGFVLVPTILFVVASRRGSVGLTQLSAFVTVAGVILNRLNTSIVALNWTLPDRELLAWRELVVVVGIVALEILVYRWIVSRMPVLREDLSFRPTWLVERPDVIAVRRSAASPAGVVSRT